MRAPTAVVLSTASIPLGGILDDNNDGYPDNEVVVTFDLNDLGTIEFISPDITGALADLSLLDQLNVLVTGLDAFLEQSKNVLESDFFSTPIPFLGDGLSDAARFIDSIQNHLISQLNLVPEGGLTATGIEDALYAASVRPMDISETPRAKST